METHPDVIIASLVGLLIIAALVVFRKRLGVLNAASWLVIFGSLIVSGEHAQWTLTISLGFAEGQEMRILPHARIHFFMAGIYALIGLILLGVIARTLLKEGRRAGWYALLFAFVVGGGFDLIMGGLWYQHGSPLYLVERPLGFGWQFLYLYLVAWITALVISWKPIFAKAPLSSGRTADGRP
jgi:hypothetical protein